MNERIRELLDAAHAGEEKDFEALLRALRELREQNFTPEELLELCHSPDGLLRRAAVDLCRGTTEPELLSALANFADDAEDQVRDALATALLDADWWTDEATIVKLLDDQTFSVRRNATKAAASRPSATGRLLELLTGDSTWEVRLAAAESLGKHAPHDTLPTLLDVMGSDDDFDVAKACAVSIDRHIKTLGGYPAGLMRPTPSTLRKALDRTDGWPKRQCDVLRAWLADTCEREIDLELLSPFGQVLTEPAQLALLPRGQAIESAVETVVKMLRAGAPPRAVVLLGPSGAGKSTIVCEVARSLARDGWHMLRVAPNDFLSGTVYLGEWQTRLKNLLAAVKSPRPIVLYIPNLEELATVGRSSKGDSNVATALAPFIERGEVTILGESTEEAYQRGLGADPALRKLFHVVAVKPASEKATRAILSGVAAELDARTTPDVLDKLCELADYANISAALPGRVVELLRRVVGSLPDRKQPITEQHILATIRASSGLPFALLDDSINLDRTALREFFESRVMGQPEAVDAAVDLVTLIKAGLTDPNKPFGVLLFVGPTGVGKTELARAMAEYCFGNPSRMVRLDMSEYATYEAYERLTGRSGEPGYLTSLIKEQPFSIVLFDEFEKAHFNVFDLCLQIFDAGRLTDGQGKTADFRRTIIVLTSNLGAGGSQEEPIGFTTVRAERVPDNRSQRDLRRTFRPEFLNRIDRIVQFQPLSEATTERIARREVSRVLERSGIARRSLSIDLDPSLFPLLLREGYSPAYGARPLKRAIERLVLLPLARSISSGEVRAGSLVRLLVRNGKVQVQADHQEEPEAAESCIVAPPADLLARSDALCARVAQFRDQATDISAKKGTLIARTTESSFWDDQLEMEQTYDQIYVLDGVLAQVEALRKAVQRLAESVASNGDGKPSARLPARFDELEAQAEHVAAMLACRDWRWLGDAVLSVTRVAGHGDSLGAVERLASMYLQLARRRHFKVEILDDHVTDAPPEDSIALLLTGVGVYSLLATEAGLHVVTRGVSERQHRETVRVDVGLVDSVPQPIARNDVTADIKPLAGVSGRLLQRPRHRVRLLHVPTMVSLHAWTDSDESTVVERLLPLLRARIELAQGTPGHSRKSQVRRYRLGPSQLVRDSRTGRKSGRLDQVLDGHLDAFLVPLKPPEA